MRQFFAFKMVLLGLAANSFGCKPLKNGSDLATLDNFARNSNARMNICSANALDGESFQEATLIPLRINVEQSLAGRMEGLIENVQLAVSAVPPEFQAMFHDLNGTIEVVASPKERCLRNEASSVPYDFTSCIERRVSAPGQQHGFSIIIEGSEGAIQHGLVRAFGQLLSEAVGAIQVNGQGQALLGDESEEFQEDAEKLAVSFMRDILSNRYIGTEVLAHYFGEGSEAQIRRSIGAGITDYRQIIARLTTLTPEEKAVQAPVFRDLVVAESFDSYVCNTWYRYDRAEADAAFRGSDMQAANEAHRNTHKVMRDFFPQTYNVFRGIYQNYRSSALALGARTLNTYYASTSVSSGFSLTADSKSSSSSKKPAPSASTPKSSSSEPSLFGRVTGSITSAAKSVGGGMVSAAKFTAGAAKGVAGSAWTGAKAVGSGIKYGAVGTGRYVVNSFKEGPMDAAAISGGNIKKDYLNYYDNAYKRAYTVSDNMMSSTSEGGAGLGSGKLATTRAGMMAVGSMMFNTAPLIGTDVASEKMTYKNYSAGERGEAVGNMAFDVGTMFVAPAALAPKVGATAVKMAPKVGATAAKMSASTGRFLSPLAQKAAVPVGKITEAASAAKKKISTAFLNERRVLAGQEYLSIGPAIRDQAGLATLRSETVSGLKSAIQPNSGHGISGTGSMQGKPGTIDLDKTIFMQERKGPNGVGGGVYEAAIQKKLAKFNPERRVEAVSYVDAATGDTRYILTNGHHHVSTDRIIHMTQQRRMGAPVDDSWGKMDAVVTDINKLPLFDRQQLIEGIQKNGSNYLDIWR